MYILIKSLISNNTFHDKVNPLVHSVQYIGRLAKFLLLFWKGSSKKNSYERRDYESVDEKSLF